MPKKLEPQHISANWSPYDDLPPWSVISSRELASVLGVHLQTINNWNIRDILPKPVKHCRLRGNKNYYRISSIKAWLTGENEADIVWGWAAQRLPEVANTVTSFEQLKGVIECAYELYGLKKPNLPCELAFDRRLLLS